MLSSNITFLHKSFKFLEHFNCHTLLLDLMPGTSNLAILAFSIYMLFHFLAFFKLQPTIIIDFLGRGRMWSRDPSSKEPTAFCNEEMGTHTG